METPKISQLDQETIRFKVRVTPGAKKPAIGGTHDGALKVAVTQIAENGKANQAVIKSIAKRLGTSKSRVSIVSGQTFRIKTIEVAGVSIEVATERLG